MSRQPFEDAPQQPDTTQPTRECPPVATGPQNGAQGRDQWADGYAAAKRFYGDTAPIAVNSARELVAQFRDQWDHAGQLTGTPVGQFLADLQAILDTAKEPR